MSAPTITLEMLRNLKADDIIKFAQQNKIQFEREDSCNSAVGVIGMYLGINDGDPYYKLRYSTNKDVMNAAILIEDGFEQWVDPQPEDPFYQLGAEIGKHVVDDEKDD